MFLNCRLKCMNPIQSKQSESCDFCESYGSSCFPSQGDAVLVKESYQVRTLAENRAHPQKESWARRWVGWDNIIWSAGYSHAWSWWPGTFRSHEPIKVLFGLSWFLFIELCIQWLFLCSVLGCGGTPYGTKWRRPVWCTNLKYTFQGLCHGEEESGIPLL